MTKYTAANVRADAIRAGLPPAMADYLVAHVGKPPAKGEDDPFLDHRTRAYRAAHGKRSEAPGRGLRMSAPLRSRTVDERRRAICDLYHAAALVPAFMAAKLPLPNVAALLANVTAGQRITPAGIANVRTTLAIAAHRGNAQ